MDRSAKQGAGKAGEQFKITERAKDYSQWYLDVIEAAGLAEHSPVKGFMVIKPHGYAIWELTQKYLDARFKETGVENAYFPLLFPESFLKREAEHVEGFAPEVAMVTHAGGKKLDEPLVIRPTSETIINETFAKWVQSYRDLPLLINQWANVVRWEMRTRLFLRTTEFLWQEGHTVHANNEEADERALRMLDIYKDFAEDCMAIPVFMGTKTESEKFAGADTTYAVEAIMQDGKALQFATSHNLGQNFTKVFGVKFLDNENVEQFGWQTSWGLSTRVIGGLIMTHSDDKGLVLPPKMAPVQIVIVPIFRDEKESKMVKKVAEKIKAALLKKQDLRVKIDERDNLRLGEKIFDWEKKGVPVRIEIGPKDIANDNFVAARRDTGTKTTIQIRDAAKVIDLLDEIQKDLFDKAVKARNAKMKKVNTWEDFKKEIEAGNFVLAHWCGEAGVEAKIQKETQATIRCIPFDSPEEAGKCVYNGKPSKRRVIFAKAY